MRQNGSNLSNSSITISTLTLVNGIRGITDGSVASPGNVGELISNLGSASSIGSSASYVAIATITLTAGDWDINGHCQLAAGGSTSATAVISGISTSSTTTSGDTTNNRSIVDYAIVANGVYDYFLGPSRANITSTTVYYQVCSLTYTVLGGAAWGADSYIVARRMR